MKMKKSKGISTKQQSKKQKSIYSSSTIRRSIRIQSTRKFTNAGDDPIKILDADIVSEEEINEGTDTGEMPEIQSVSLDKIDQLQTSPNEDFLLDVNSGRSKEILTYSQ